MVHVSTLMVLRVVRDEFCYISLNVSMYWFLCWLAERGRGGVQFSSGWLAKRETVGKKFATPFIDEFY